MPIKRTAPDGYERANRLRLAMTPAEVKLWAYLRKKQINDAKFRRQHAIGPYIVDFCCIKLKLVIELDGSQHIDPSDYDKARTEFLLNRGYRILRFWNDMVMNDIEGVIQSIEQAVLD